MADIVPIFHILNDIVHSKLGEHMDNLRLGGHEFDVTAKNMNNICSVVMQDDARQSIEECTDVTVSPKTYMKILNRNINLESKIDIPTLTIRARADALYARDFFETYWDVVMRPEHDRLHNRRIALDKYICETHLLRRKFRSDGLFTVSAFLTHHLDDCWREWGNVCFQECYYISAYKYDKNKAKILFTVADDFMRSHQTFVRAGDELKTRLTQICNKQRKHKTKG